jgi:hypothetical protein
MVAELRPLSSESITDPSGIAGYAPLRPGTRRGPVLYAFSRLLDVWFNVALFEVVVVAHPSV